MVFNVDWIVIEVFFVFGLFGYMKSEYESNSVKVYLELFVDMIIDYCEDCFYGINSYVNGFDFIDIDEYCFYEIDLVEDKVDNSFVIVKFDSDYLFFDISILKFGVFIKDFEYSNNFE